MGKYKVVLSPKAYKDLHNIFEYIGYEKQSISNAYNLTERIYDSLKNLSIFPKSHPKILFGEYAEKDYRQFVIEKYLAIYKVDNVKQIVTIIRIIHQGQLINV